VPVNCFVQGCMTSGIGGSSGASIVWQIARSANCAGGGNPVTVRGAWSLMCRQCRKATTLAWDWYPGRTVNIIHSFKQLLHECSSTGTV
jgi:hypothetical protein